MSQEQKHDVAGCLLAGVPGATPGRVRALLERWPDPIAALAAIRSDETMGLGLGLPSPAAVRAVEHRVALHGTRALAVTDPGYPIRDPLPGRPALLLMEGARPEVLDAPRVAVVGTRAATPAGRADARHLGAYLTVAGVTVVSGLAIGIDGEAHLGALAGIKALCSGQDGSGQDGSGQNGSGQDGSGRVDRPVAGPVGVVATGLDVVYPRRHLALYDRVRRSGVLISEHGFGVSPAPGRFPVRNRIIAALADVVVVVEATDRGGSRITAEQALDYGRPVLAIPGSRRNPSAAGCNALLADGAQPLLDPSDVLIALGLTPGARRGWAPLLRPERPLGAAAASVLRALAGEAAHPDEIGARTGLDSDVVVLAVEDLCRAGLARRERGFVWPL